MRQACFDTAHDRSANTTGVTAKTLLLLLPSLLPHAPPSPDTATASASNCRRSASSARGTSRCAEGGGVGGGGTGDASASAASASVAAAAAASACCCTVFFRVPHGGGGVLCVAAAAAAAAAAASSTRRRFAEASASAAASAFLFAESPCGAGATKCPSDCQSDSPKAGKNNAELTPESEYMRRSSSVARQSSWMGGSRAGLAPPSSHHPPPPPPGSFGRPGSSGALPVAPNTAQSTSLPLSPPPRLCCCCCCCGARDNARNKRRPDTTAVHASCMRAVPGFRSPFAPQAVMQRGASELASLLLRRGSSEADLASFSAANLVSTGVSRKRVSWCVCDTPPLPCEHSKHRPVRDAESSL